MNFNCKYFFHLLKPLCAGYSTVKISIESKYDSYATFKISRKTYNLCISDIYKTTLVIANADTFIKRKLDMKSSKTSRCRDEFSLYFTFFARDTLYVIWLSIISDTSDGYWDYSWLYLLKNKRSSHSGFLLTAIPIFPSKEISVRGPVPIGCALGDHDHQRDIHCARFPSRLFDRRSRLCGGSRFISLSANLYNTETIMEPRPWNISIARRPITWSDSLVDVKRWEREWKRCAERFDGTSIRSHGSSNLKTMTVTVSQY